MEQKIDNKEEIKDKLYNKFNNNKKKIYIFLGIFIISIISFNIIKINIEKENVLIAEKYSKAEIFFTLGDKEKTVILLDQIILSKNSFYSVLALNKILEKKLVSDKNQILNYFEILSETKQSQENRDIINFKKALFLIKNSDIEKGNELLNELIKDNSSLKSLAEEIVLK
tara:strand:- start:892 stop:1401 length:510 start_codon:yes stop_codon:yes gene_type:complete